MSPGSALRRFQWHAEDQPLREWGLRDRGLESSLDQNEMNIQSEAKPHGLICPFTMAVIIWDFPRLLLRQDEKALWQEKKKRKVSHFCFGKSLGRKLAVSPHRSTWKSQRRRRSRVKKEVQRCRPAWEEHNQMRALGHGEDEMLHGSVEAWLQNTLHFRLLHSLSINFIILFFDMNKQLCLQAPPLWYLLQTCGMKLNIKLYYSSKNRPPFAREPFWCELLMDPVGTQGRPLHIFHKNTAFGIGGVGLRGRSLTWNGSISVHITEHIPYKAAASVYSLPPVRCWHAAAALYPRPCAACVVFSLASAALRGD